MTREEAALANCQKSEEARRLKQNQLHREIRASGASETEKANMLHTLSKLTMFAADERDQLVRLGTPHMYYGNWLDGLPVNSNEA